MATYGDVMATYAAQEAASWQDGETRDLSEDMMRLTLRIVGRTSSAPMSPVTPPLWAATWRWSESALWPS